MRIVHIKNINSSCQYDRRPINIMTAREGYKKGQGAYCHWKNPIHAHFLGVHQDQ